ncbi:MAG: hypothetical protein MRY63_00775 [Neomegalonema sp.]|nr:hypothetical protein [Neomegalonema sp.]
MQPERSIICGDANSAGQISVTIDGERYFANFSVDTLSNRLSGVLTDAALDLVELAAYVYAADAIITRGGDRERFFGESWRRKLFFDVPVRALDLWRSPPLAEHLASTLAFLSDDEYRFSFRQRAAQTGEQPSLQFGADTNFQPETVMLFSGGLDSLGGALDETISRQRNVLLVTHLFDNALERAQLRRIHDLRAKTEDRRLQQVSAKLQLTDGANRESTHRARSFTAQGCLSKDFTFVGS